MDVGASPSQPSDVALAGTASPSSSFIRYGQKLHQPKPSRMLPGGTTHGADGGGIMPARLFRPHNCPKPRRGGPIHVYRVCFFALSSLRHPAASSPMSSHSRQDEPGTAVSTYPKPPSVVVENTLSGQMDPSGCIESQVSTSFPPAIRYDWKPAMLRGSFVVRSVHLKAKHAESFAYLALGGEQPDWPVERHDQWPYHPFGRLTAKILVSEPHLALVAYRMTEFGLVDRDGLAGMVRRCP